MATAPQLRATLQLVFSYAHEDESLRDRLAAHLSSLERAHVIECWHDRDIRAGEGWRDEINRAIARADVILLLISPDFVASDYCFTIEMADALKRHAAGTALVIPVLLRPVAATAGEPWGELQGLPRDLRAATLWPNLDEALADVARGVLEAVEAFRPALPSPATRLPSEGEPVAEDRVFDAAVPARVQVGQTSEIVSLVRTPDSGGLRAILAADDTFAARPEGVRSQELSLDFPRDAQGRPLPLRLTLVLESPDFLPPRQTKRIQIPPQGDSATYVFLAVPRRAGLLALELELLSGDVSIVSHLLRSRADEAAPMLPRRYVVATLPLTTTGVEEMPIDPSTTLTNYPVSPPPPSAQSRPRAAASPVPKPSDTWPPVSRESSRGSRPASMPSPASRASRTFAVPALGAVAAAVLVSTSAWFWLQRPESHVRPWPTDAPVPTTLSTAIPSPFPSTGPVPSAFPPPTPMATPRATPGPIEPVRPPMDPAVLLTQAKALYEKRDFAGVVALVDKSDAPTPELNQLAGRSLYELKEYRLAAARFRLAVEADPSNAEHVALLKRAQEAGERKADTKAPSPSRQHP